MRRFLNRRAMALAAAVVATVAVAGMPAATAGTAVTSSSATTTQNAVSDSFSDTYADPSVIRGKDGWWYTYATSDPLRSGGEHGLMHMARTRDWSAWEYLGSVFTDATRPAWAEPTAGLWAPDIRQVGDHYVLYFTVTNTRLHDGDDSAIGAATAPTPAGPWTATDAPVVAPRAAPGGGWWWTFDPAGFTDVDGQRYLYFGSYFGGLWVTRVAPDGLTTIGAPVQVAIDNRYEGAYVVRHDGWYHLMGSSANCCAGPATGYSVFTGRSRSPLGPFVDAEGTSLTASRVGGTPVLTQNGNRFVGVGHHAVISDGAGADFVVYHGIDRTEPWLNAPFGINRRPMLVDRLDWVDGWPRTRAGAGPSDTEQPGPSLASALGITPEAPASGGFTGLYAGPSDPLGGATGLVRGTARTVQSAPGPDVHVRLDLKAGEATRVVVGRDPTVTVTVDPQAQTLSVGTEVGRRALADSAPAARASGWQTLTVEGRAGQVRATLSENDLADPYAEVAVSDPVLRLAPAQVRLSSGRALVDNVVVNRRAEDTATAVPVPQAGAVITSEEFDDADLPGLSWLRPNPAATVEGGQLRWPVEGTDLVGGDNQAGLLLHDAPGDGDWLVETKVHLDLGVDSVRNYQQAGLVAYADDDDFARLGTVAIWNTRQTEYGRELAAAPDGRTAYGGAIIGTAAPTIWMRLAHHRNAAGEHLFRAATSRDGQSWTWGATWALGADSAPRIALYAHGGASPATVASFDYLRFHATTWPADPGAG
jgi:beta-xylosidase